MTKKQTQKILEELQKKSQHGTVTVPYVVPNHFGGACPNCGYCPHCGRGVQLQYPYYQPIWIGLPNTIMCTTTNTYQAK